MVDTLATVKVLNGMEDLSKPQTEEQKSNQTSIFKKFALIIGSLIFTAVLIQFIKLNLYKQIPQPQLVSSEYLQLHQAERQLKDSLQPKRRNLNVWTSNCCLTSLKCGMFIEDCCQMDDRGCNWYFFCYTKADDKNCLRVRSIVKKLDGYWSI